MTEPETKAQDVLRDGILASGHDDFVSMADVQARVGGGLLADLSTERQQLVVDTVRSLLVDGLVEVGVIPSPSSPGFKTWPGTVDEVMTRFIDRFVGHQSNPREWQYKIWLNLTTQGEQVSDAIVRASDQESHDGTIQADAAFNAEIAAAIEKNLAESDYGKLLSERGITTVALNENGEIVEHHPDRPLVPPAEESGAIPSSDLSDPAS